MLNFIVVAGYVRNVSVSHYADGASCQFFELGIPRRTRTDFIKCRYFSRPKRIRDFLDLKEGEAVNVNGQIGTIAGKDIVLIDANYVERFTPVPEET